MIDAQGWLRCDKCNKKFGRVIDFTGRIEVVCDRCNYFNVFKNKVLTVVYNIDKEKVIAH